MSKNWRNGDESLLKNGTIKQQMVTLTKQIIPGQDLHCADPLALRGFLQHLSAKYK